MNRKVRISIAEFEWNFDLHGPMRYIQHLKMVFHAPTMARFAGATSLCLAVWTAPAQSSLTPSDSLDKELAPRHHLDINSQLSAPQNLFGPSVDEAMAPPMAPPVNPLQQMVQQKPNWTEMTPDEILGVQTSPQEKEAKELAARMRESGQTLPNQSALETFLMNRRLAETGTTNLNSRDEGGNFLDPVTGLADPRKAAAMQNATVFRSQPFNRLLENSRDSLDENNQLNSDAAWARVFTTPVTAGPTPEQQAEMSAFQQLLQPAQPAATTADKTGFGFPQPAPLPDPNLEPAPVGYNPAGASFAPLESGIGRPKRLPSLPTVTTMPTVPSLPPAWGPQPPPWTIKTPQLFVEPVRQF